MAEEFVGRKEFDNLKEEVNEIKKDLVESQKLLCQIDKKLDVISEKMISSDKIDDLKLTPLEKRISTLEENHKFLKNTIIATVIGIVVKLIFDISKLF